MKMFNKIRNLFKRKNLTMSDELRSFLSEWQDWVEQGAVEGRGFSRMAGLCSSCPIRSVAELNKLFTSCGLCHAFPFGEREYMYGHNNCLQHKDPKRLAWVKDAVNGKLTRKWKPRYEKL